MTLSALGIDFAYGERSLLKGLDLALESGQMVGLLGANGSGKSTLLRLLAGLTSPQRGRICLEGQPLPKEARQRARRLTLVLQKEVFAFDFSVSEVVASGRYAHLEGWGYLSSHDQAQVELALQRLSLSSLRDRLMSQLSGGEQQRVRLARALAQDPDFLLLDEPIAHLDIAHQVEILQHLQAMARLGKGVVLAIHDLTLAARFCQRLVCLKEGAIVGDGTPQEVCRAELLSEVFSLELEVISVQADSGPIVVPRTRRKPEDEGAEPRALSCQ